MPTVSVLYIEDETVGPHLQLLRYVCEPQSRARPHLTVRYSERVAVPRQYHTIEIGEVEVLQPAEFVSKTEAGERHTVYIRCHSEDLAWLEYKPHYPHSEFHVTVYDGADASFAASLLKTLRRYDWGFVVSLPPGTRLKQIRLGVSSERVTARRYSRQLSSLYAQIRGAPLRSTTLVNLTVEDRLRLVADVCEHLMISTAGLPRAPEAAPRPEAEPTADGDRRLGDIFLTPPELARAIAEYAVDQLAPDIPIHFGDPAVGTGAFFAALLQVVPRERIASAVGVDIAPKQVAAARWRWSNKGMEVLLDDYLHMEKLPSRNLVLANPPYLRHQDIPLPTKQSLRERASVCTGLQVSGRAGLYVYFMLLAHPWMQPDATAAWLVPAEFMQTAYGRAVRRYLARQVDLVRIHQFDHDVPQFENAKVLPALIVLRNRSPEPQSEVLLSVGGTVSAPRSSELHRQSELDPRQKWHLPLRQRRPARATDVTLGEIFNIKRGLATGANDFFIMTRGEARDLGIPLSVVRPILPKARYLTSAVVERGPGGFPDVEPQLVVLDTDLPMEQIRSDYPDLAEYLETARERGVRSRTLVRSRTPWYSQEARRPAPFLCMYMGRGAKNGPPLRFLWNKSEAVAANTYLMMYPTPALQGALDRDPDRARELHAVLRATARKTVEEKARMHAGGLHKIEPSELREVRLARVPRWLRDARERTLR